MILRTLLNKCMQELLLYEAVKTFYKKLIKIFTTVKQIENSYV
jgi:hypothetical protein